MGGEQRAEVRVGYQSQAVVIIDGKKHATRTVNLSRTGLRLLAPPKIGGLAENAEVEVQLTFDWTSDWVRIPAHLVYEHRDNGMRFWGLRFRSLPKDARILIGLFVHGKTAPKREASIRSVPAPAPSKKPAPPPPRKTSAIKSLIDDVVHYLHEEDAFKPKGKKAGR